MIRKLLTAGALLLAAVLWSCGASCEECAKADGGTCTACEAKDTTDKAADDAKDAADDAKDKADDAIDGLTGDK